MAIIIGRLIAAQILDKETILQILKIIRNIPKDPSPTSHEIPRNIPRPVATALPPFPFSQIGQI